MPAMLIGCCANAGTAKQNQTARNILCIDFPLLMNCLRTWSRESLNAENVRMDDSGGDPRCLWLFQLNPSQIRNKRRTRCNTGQRHDGQGALLNRGYLGFEYGPFGAGIGTGGRIVTVWVLILVVTRGYCCMRNHTRLFTDAPAQASTVEQDYENHKESQNPHRLLLSPSWRFTASGG